MTTLAVGVITGHKARGTARLQAVRQRRRRAVHLEDLWVAPSAPNVRLYVGPRTDGRVDDTAVDLGPLPDRVSRSRPGTVVADEVRSVIVYCKVNAEHLGAATLTLT